MRMLLNPLKIRVSVVRFRPWPPQFHREAPYGSPSGAFCFSPDSGPAVANPCSGTSPGRSVQEAPRPGRRGARDKRASCQGPRVPSPPPRRRARLHPRDGDVFRGVQVTAPAPLHHHGAPRAPPKKLWKQPTDTSTYTRAAPPGRPAPRNRGRCSFGKIAQMSCFSRRNPHKTRQFAHFACNAPRFALRGE